MGSGQANFNSTDI